MHFLDYTSSSPVHNLACDEALLDLCEDGAAGELLRLWEPQSYFVVLGSSNKVADEVRTEVCETDCIPIFRRHSGGGTVLQGPGCLNYSLILPIDESGPTRNITETTHYVMRRHAALFSTLLGVDVTMQGSSDLTIAGRKFSGNAQRRKLRALLFHGTFLLEFDLRRIERYLKIPPKQPAYRDGRSHLDFVRNVGVDSLVVKEELSRLWQATEALPLVPHNRIDQLVQDKYSSADWTFRL